MTEILLPCSPSRIRISLCSTSMRCQILWTDVRVSGQKQLTISCYVAFDGVILLKILFWLPCRPHTTL